MRTIRIMFLFFVVLMPARLAWPQTSILAASVPFQNIVLQPNQIIIAAYNFGVFSAIYCYENSMSQKGGMFWTYNNNVYSSILSQFTLIKSTATGFQGNFADNIGGIIIVNNAQYNSNANPLVVSCQFAF